MNIIDYETFSTIASMDENTLYLKGSMYWLWHTDESDMELVILPMHKFRTVSSNHVFNIDHEHALFDRYHNIMKDKTGAEIVKTEHYDYVNRISFKIELANANDDFMKVMETGQVLNDTKRFGTGGRLGETKKGKYEMLIPTCKLNENEIRFMKMSMLGDGK